MKRIVVWCKVSNLLHFVGGRVVDKQSLNRRHFWFLVCLTVSLWWLVKYFVMCAWWVSVTPCGEYFIKQSPVTHTKSVYMFNHWCCVLASIDYLCYNNTCFICCYSVKFVLQDSSGVRVYLHGFAQYNTTQ